MLDIKLLRTNFDEVAKALEDRNEDFDLSQFKTLDENRRNILAEVEVLKARQNKVSKEIPVMKKDGKDTAPVMAEMKKLSEEIKALDAKAAEADRELQDYMLTLPNIPNPTVPKGKSDEDNVEIRRWGEPTKFGFEPKAHWDLGKDLNILDPETAAKISGSRFTVYRGDGARLERAITNFYLDVHTAEHGYTEVFPPFMVSRESMTGTGIEGTVLGLLGSRDSTALLNLFQSNSYDIEQMISDYSTDENNRYYTQRYYIYSQDAGSETLCNYMPPTDDYNVIHGQQWTRFDTTDPDFHPNSGQREQALSNSESYAGWSRSRVNQLNQANDGYHYNISYYSNAYIISRNGSQRQKAYAYSISVTKSWNNREEVYDDVFDSYSMDLNAFLSKMNAKLYYYNTQQENGKKYYLGMDSKHYFQATDAAKVKGISAVTYTVHCTDGQKLGEGSTSWKENGNQGSSLSENSKRFAMETSLEDTNPTSELDQMLVEKQTEIDDLNSQISHLEQEQNNISVQLRDLGYDADLMARYNEIQNQLNTLESQLRTAKESYRQIQDAIEEAREEFADVTDDVTRIPAIMHNVQSAYHITWQGEGYWSGYEYIRKGKMEGMESVVTFRARLSLQRKPKYFLGIRIHRAILQIDWELTSEYSYSDVVEVMQVDPDLDDQHRADVINQRLSEIAKDYPLCTVEAEYRRSNTVEVEDDDSDLPHLLWASERLAIARDIESRLVTIYTKLAMLERYIKTSRSLQAMLFETVMNGIDHSKRRLIGIEALNRWKESAGKAILTNNRRRDEEPGGGI